MNRIDNHTPHNHKEPRLDEPPAVEIIHARKSYYIGKMEVPVQARYRPILAQE